VFGSPKKIPAMHMCMAGIFFSRKNSWLWFSRRLRPHANHRTGGEDIYIRIAINPPAWLPEHFVRLSIAWNQFSQSRNYLLNESHLTRPNLYLSQRKVR
jgi:hypothetical protein